ncbi:hypothetical protein POVWA2_035660 [Plasmodium ovale wallikeri]|uniref:Uncharacterized protein n=1 Tax=Plasmodium ovale wallikeri TaxID=864142 RepID=A0A1A8Z170_PLAOA|nr:hypothetical protein POVWA1_036360 [Plasmodium ovale wallikeri]SBT38376.1 hypothetical protein POVWA2_035660 [Plasmodium ovale wallikeri]
MYTELPVIDSVPYINETVHEEADKIRAKNVAKYKYITIFKYGKPNLCHANDETKFFSSDNTKKSGMRIVPYVLLRDIVLQHCLQYKKRAQERWGLKNINMFMEAQLLAYSLPLSLFSVGISN